MSAKITVLLPTPELCICQICGRTVLKDYEPYTPVCMACALESKAEGHRQMLPSEPYVPVKSPWRGFEPTPGYWERLTAAIKAAPKLPEQDPSFDPEPFV